MYMKEYHQFSAERLVKRMKVEELYYELPNDLLARKPKELLDEAEQITKLLVMDRSNKDISHMLFEDCISFFGEGDVLVLNNSKTIKADLIGWFENSVRINIQLACDLGNNKWLVYSFSEGIRSGGKAVFGETRELLSCRFIKNTEGSIWEVQFLEQDFWKRLDKVGRAIMSPYVDKKYDVSFYQNEYSCNEGSTEMPAAGRHFKISFLDKLKERGVKVAFVTLHTGLSSIEIEESYFEQHKMHYEKIEVEEETAKIINEAKAKNKRIFAVGTTVVRTLESCIENGRVIPYKGYTNLYIYPGYDFKIIDCFFTNFHGPHSTRIAMAAAFTGSDLLMKGYKAAIEQKYKFYEFGDTTLTI